jgi:hypothetical protein
VCVCVCVCVDARACGLMCGLVATRVDALALCRVAGVTQLEFNPHPSLAAVLASSSNTDLLIWDTDSECTPSVWMGEFVYCPSPTAVKGLSYR